MKSENNISKIIINKISNLNYNKKIYNKNVNKVRDFLNNVEKQYNYDKDIFHLFSKKLKINFKKETIKKFNKFNTIILIGMGGSTLGAEAIYNSLNFKIKKNFIFMNNLDTYKVEKIKKDGKHKNALFLIVSKSGNTIETMANLSLLKQKNYSSKNTIIITENKSSELFNFAKLNKIQIIEHKNYIGGRFSVLSEVGLLPAYLMKLSIKEIRKNVNNFFKPKYKKLLCNNVSQIAQCYSSKDIKSLILINYYPPLNSFMYWAQQLIAESLGKNKKGLIPIVSIAPKDHHSLLQLYLDGPKDKIYYIISSKGYSNLKMYSNDVSKKLKYLKNKKIETIVEAQKNALISSFKKKKIPYREIVTKPITESLIGELFSTFIVETILIAKILKINPLDQPAVEQVKILTKKYLSK